MSSLKREEEFRANKQRYDAMQKSFKTTFWMAIIPSIGVWVALTLYYVIRGLALLAGASMIMGEYWVYQTTGDPIESDLFYHKPVVYMGFLFVIGLLTFFSYAFKKKFPLYILFAVYGAGAVYGLVALVTGKCGILMGLYLIAYGGYGIWLSDFILRLFKEQKYLSLQEGYPNFDSAINEPRPMANTSGLYYNRSEYLKRQQKEKKEKGEAVSEPQSWEMDELPLDAELPKGNRKIDNMM